MRRIEFERLLNERFQGRVFSSAQIGQELNLDGSEISRLATEAVRAGRLFVDKTWQTPIYSFEPFPSDGAVAVALATWKERFGDALFTVAEAAAVVGYPVEWVRATLRRVYDARNGSLSYKKRTKQYCFAKLKRTGRPNGSKSLNCARERVERLAALRKEFPPPCRFDSLGAREFLGVDWRPLKGFCGASPPTGDWRAKRLEGLSNTGSLNNYGTFKRRRRAKNERRLRTVDTRMV